MKENDVILKRQSTQIFFKNGDTDFFFNWLLGIGEILVSLMESFIILLKDWGTHQSLMTGKMYFYRM